MKRLMVWVIKSLISLLSIFEGVNMPKCVICDYEGTTEPDKYGNYIFYWDDEPICMACREEHSLELDAGIKPSHIKKE